MFGNGPPCTRNWGPIATPFVAPSVRQCSEARLVSTGTIGSPQRPTGTRGRTPRPSAPISTIHGEAAAGTRQAGRMPRDRGVEGRRSAASSRPRPVTATLRNSTIGVPATGTIAGTLTHSTTATGLNPAGIGSPGWLRLGTLITRLPPAGHLMRLAAASTRARLAVVAAGPLVTEPCPDPAPAAWLAAPAAADGGAAADAHAASAAVSMSPTTAVPSWPASLARSRFHMLSPITESAWVGRRHALPGSRPVHGICPIRPLAPVR